MVNLLLMHRADPNKDNKHKETALMWATLWFARNKNKEMIESLVQYGATVTDWKWWTQRIQRGFSNMPCRDNPLNHNPLLLEEAKKIIESAMCARQAQLQNEPASFVVHKSSQKLGCSPSEMKRYQYCASYLSTYRGLTAASFLMR